jgi:hypothetical protein
MTSFYHSPERVLAIVYAILLTCIIFSATLELFAPVNAHAVVAELNI